MYQQYWNVECNPFEGGFDSRFFVPTRTHKAALLKLKYLIEDRKQAGLLVGGTGHGKTCLVHQLIHELPDGYGPVAHLVYPQLSAAEMLSWLAFELGAEESFSNSYDVGLDQILRQIVRQLAIHTQENRHPVIVIDEAHMIDDLGIFQSLRLLLNFQDKPEIDFTLILVGERSLLGRLGRMADLDERLAVKAMLRSLSLEETEQYVLHRLQAAGKTDIPFDQSAIQTLFELSGGVPRKINRICDLAFLVGYADQLTTFSANEIEAVTEELTVVTAD